MRVCSLVLLMLLAGPRAGTAADTPGPTLVPIPLKLPPPAFKSVMVENLRNDSHVEQRATSPRSAFLAPAGVSNLAFQRPVTSSAHNAPASALSRITDGEKDCIEDNIVALKAGKQWVQVDLGQPCRIYAIIIWHDERQSDIFKSVIVQAASDPTFKQDVITLFNNDYQNNLGFGPGPDKEYWETYEGKLVDAKGVTARYVRCYSMGARRNPLNQYIEVEVWGLAAE